MNLSFKDLRFIIEAIEHQINAYQERLQVIEDIEEDEAADLGNDIKFLELLLADMKKSLEHNTSVKPLSSDEVFSPDRNDNSSEYAKEELSFQELMKLTLNLSLSERLFLVEAITSSVRQEVTINQ
ncbi:MAG: hypothetical protein JGK24_08835 [Microcoleus sp. PH2017_29_MFU_D_A]|jgi:hypothetical protein|uniref:hypothetical protein n=1 Tax=unclassified Microcoleus TaxID=2642155 RepID=UPI001D867507|nr:MULTISPECIES: hypothetical protein [unclassified Microcoleus]MCC3431787.1 hypothetical protein [Microcoleus sp. PH2017_04_SCI_O_A]MCC3441651.1 hypothetical protein [Microcoleus sp. PH2017_03_ELD_O_A]MCC3466830.1 hypothetical protein [Microcoleus sp. PH2017_06_SFM_O_A]MCC3505308.1 hypothetical protein [Microcoleus sp. PH2017_19_SFW_U_A]MCC3510679.1 hypothetical protein [Microcoleus sp. PH2017_17_BER_D_A]TAE13154.1 MAG: hypothetical protein EAZ94_10640 [Oscillatoriales cyanobacterium]